MKATPKTLTAMMESPTMPVILPAFMRPARNTAISR